MTFVTDPETVPATHAPMHDAPAAPRWSLPTRIAFRFIVIYASIYILLTQMFGGLVVLPFGLNIPAPGQAWTVTTAVNWVTTKVLKFPEPLVLFSGSGDKPIDWAFAFALLVLAAVTTAVWSVAARRRLAHPAVHKWFRLFLRFALGSTMLSYGMAKAVPLQMSFPGFRRLLEPYGDFSLMGVLWAKIGASPSYEIVTGVVEAMCAVLLFIPGLTTVGALLSFATATQIFMLNMTYDVPVKLFSFHLIVFSLVLLAPDVRRLCRVLVFRKAADAAPEPPLARSLRTRRILAGAQLVFGAWLFWTGINGSKEGWYQYGGGAPKPPLYGIWQIDRMTIDGVERAPLVTDYDRWRRMLIETMTGVHFQRMDNTFQFVPGKIDAAAKTITFTQGQGDQAKEVGRFTYDQPAADRLITEGVLNGRRFRFETSLVDHTQFNLVKGQFRWIQERPFNR